MPFSTRRLATLFASLAFCAASAHAAPIAINFEAYPGADGVLGTSDDIAPPDFDLVRDQFSALGLTFSQGSLFRHGFFDGNPDNHFLSSTSPVATLSVPVYGISIESYSYWNANLTAYDSQGNILARNTLLNPNEESEPWRGTLSVASATPIYRFTVQADSPSLILNLDNLTLQTSPVPEPSQYMMLAAGLALVAGRKLRHKA